MAFDYSYSGEIKDNIRRVIQSYQDFLNFDSAVEEKQAGMLQYLNANVDCDADELRKIHNHYRDRLAKGHVYLVLYENEGISDNDKLSIKIGYAKNVDQRLKYYKCKDVPKEFLAVIPSKTTDTRRGPRTDRLEALLGAHLLEQILHAVLAQRQRDRQCFCKKKGYSIHGEVFDFEPVLGIENEWKAAQSRVEDLKDQMNKWAAIVRKAEEAFKAAYTVHNPILYAIEQKLERAGQSLYNFS
ncbi:hypothetical protein BGX24_002770 [Mortierella sp. AD032]|nr:hypothetical protein BGX24_002770 [Mortierella sp. AD032]